MASNPKRQELPEDNERGILVTGLLDLLCPFPRATSTMLHELISRERREITSRAGWDSMPIEQLREVAEPYL